MTRKADPLPSERRRRQNRAQANKRPHRRVRARSVIPGRRYKITRRCLERRFFLTPDCDVRNALGYILAWCLEEYGLQLHAACFMANHYHLDVTDLRGNFPAFKCKLNSLIAKAFNAKRGRFDRFWSADAPCDVELVSDDDVISRMAYTLANPVSAGLVRRARRWPGLTTAGLAFGTKVRFKRPSWYFDAANLDVPDTAELTVVRPDVMKELSDEQLLARLEDEVRDIEADVQERLRKSGRRFLGESRLFKQRWNDHPNSRATRFGTRPTVAASNKWARVAALQRNARWDADYAAAYEGRLRGERYSFPYGCYAERRFHGARVAPPPG